MTISAPVTTIPTAASTTGGTVTTPDAMQKLSGNFNTFLTLLTAQIKNQDPTSPMDSSSFTQQLVEYSQVEQQINSNTNLQTLISQGKSQSGAYATSYLGKTVTVTGGQAPLINGAANWTYNLPAAAAVTMLAVTDANGRLVYSGAGSVQSGNNNFAWNGRDNNGNQLPDGAYTLNVAAKDSSGAAIAGTVSTSGKVSEIDMSSGTPQLMIGPMAVSLSGISNVAN
jgi:flagellar basal-body rod modification protein FlgD